MTTEVQSIFSMLLVVTLFCETTVILQVVTLVAV